MRIFRRAHTLISSLILVGGLSLAGTEAQALTCSDVRQLISLYLKLHFSYNSFDDELSRRSLDNFVKSWDPGKVYFFESDIKEFEDKYATKLDNMIMSNDCSAIDAIMTRYSQRFEERQKLAYKLLEEKYDFNADEYLTVDTKKLPYPKTQEEVTERWRKRIKFQLLSLKSTMSTIEKSKEKVVKRYDLALKRHNDLTKDKVLGVFLNAFSTALDPHTSYMPVDELEDFRIKTRLSLEGIGASLRTEDGFTIVAGVVKGGAAEKGGLLKLNDKIIAVGQSDGEAVDVIDMDLQDVVKKIRGARGTVVKLTVIRESGDKTDKLVIPIVREKIQLLDQQASSKMIEVKVKEGDIPRTLKVGVITLPSFYIDFEGRQKREKDFRSSSADTIREINRLTKDGVDSIVLDLRSNGGGSLDESVNLAGLFFDKGPVVQVRDHSGDVEVYQDKDGKTFYNGPLVVMINRHSASASEIFAGAIQDYGRGLVVGDSHTFGKGTVQTLNDVSSTLGAIKVTVNKFYRASGASTQLEGVASDIKLPSLVDELEIGEKYYDYALPFDTIKGSQHQKFDMVSKYAKPLAERSEKRVAESDKFKQIFEEIEKYRKNVEERSRVSLKDKEKDKKDAKNDKNKRDMDTADNDQIPENDGTVNLKDDFYLQETVKIAADYAQLIKNRKLGDVSIPAVDEAIAKDKKVAGAAAKEKDKKAAAADTKQRGAAPAGADAGAKHPASSN